MLPAACSSSVPPASGMLTMTSVVVCVCVGVCGCVEKLESACGCSWEASACAREWAGSEGEGMPASHPAIRAWPRRGARQGKAVIIEFWPQHYDHPQPGGWPISCGRALEAMSATKHSQLPSNQPASHQAGAQQPAGCTPGSQRARAKRDTALREVNVLFV